MDTNSTKLLNGIHVMNNITKYTLDNDNEIVQCAFVRGGYFQSNYKDWIQHSKPCVRKLITETYPKYIPLLPCRTEWKRTQVKSYLLEQTKPELDVLEKFLANIKPSQNHNIEIIALQLKYESMIREMTTIEKTMSPYQLYAANSPFWTVELTASGLKRFINREKYNGKLPKILFDDYYNNAIQGLYFDDNVDFDSLYPASIINLIKGI